MPNRLSSQVDDQGPGEHLVGSGGEPSRAGIILARILRKR